MWMNERGRRRYKGKDNRSTLNESTSVVSISYCLSKDALYTMNINSSTINTTN